MWRGDMSSSHRVSGFSRLECPVGVGRLNSEGAKVQSCVTNPFGEKTLSGRGSSTSSSSCDGQFRHQGGEISWAALISQQSKSGQGRQALKLYQDMRKHGVEPGQHTFVLLLKACSSLQDLKTAKYIHAEVVRNGLETDLFVGTMLVNAYVKCGSLENARRVFEEMPHRDVVSWNSMISGYAQMEKGEEALQLYRRMHQEGVVSNDRVYVGALKACTAILGSVERSGGDDCVVKGQCLDTVRAIHADVRKGKCESNVFVGNTLVDAYSKCGSLEDARRVFESMPVHTVVSWTAMIFGCAQMGRAEDALHMFRQMRLEGVIPDERAYVGALTACIAIAELGQSNGGDVRQCLETVRAIHTDVGGGNLASSLFVGNMLVDAYTKCGSLEDARQAFDEMPRRDVGSWNSMISGYSQMEKGEESLQLYTRMRQDGVVPNDQTYLLVLKACSIVAELADINVGQGIREKERCLEVVKSIHADIGQGGKSLDRFLGTMLVDAYAKCGSLENARHVFEKLPVRDVVSWTAMILGYAEMEEGEEALRLYEQMQEDGVLPNSRTYIGALKACSTIRELRKGNSDDGSLDRVQYLRTVRDIHANVVNGNFEGNLFVANKLVDAYSKCGSLEDARKVFEDMPVRSVVSWNSMVLGYAMMAKGEEALQLYARMQEEGVVPNDRTYVGAIKACTAIVESAERNGGDVIKVRKQCLESVRAIHADVKKGKFELNLFVGNVLVDAYAKCGSLEDAREMFEKVPRRDVVSWNSMILGYAQMDKGEEALQLFTRMQQEGIIPNERTYVGALNACSNVAGLEKGREIHGQILNAGLEFGSYISNSLIDMYGKCSSMVDAQQVFDRLPRKDIAAWNALLGGYARQGESDFVLDLFRWMEKEGLQPNDLTFVGLLMACSHGGLVDRGQALFQAMSREYSITPTMQHYNCMVDLLGRAGRIHDAMDMVKTMPIQPDSGVWKCLLAACRKWGNVELGRQAFESAVRLDKSDAAAYVLMSNIYAAAHIPQEAKKVQEMRVQSQAWKEPGRSWWMDLSGNAHVFVVGDQSHSESQDIYVKLGDLLVEIRESGPCATHSLVVAGRGSRRTTFNM